MDMFRATVLTTLFGLAGTAWSAQVTHPREANPYPDTRPKLEACIERRVTKDQSLVILINRCARFVYVSVVEFSPLEAEKWCSVFGLQGKGYGKAYSSGDWYEQSSVQVSSSSDAALRHCARTGYRTLTRDHGQFIQVTKGKSKRSTDR